MSSEKRSKTRDAQNEPSLTPSRSIETSNLKITSQKGSSTRDETQKKRSRAPLGSIPAPNDKSAVNRIANEQGSLQLVAKNPNNVLISAHREEVDSLQEDVVSSSKDKVSLEELNRERNQLPSLPTELHRYILQLADTGSLAMAGRVNNAFWDIAKELLYRHVDIKDAESLALLFRPTPTTSSTPLDQVRIDLLTQIRTLTFHFPPVVRNMFVVPRLGLPDGIEPLDLHHLRITTQIVDNSNHDDALLEYLFPLLNPTNFHFLPLPPHPQGAQGANILIPNSSMGGWRTLEVVRMTYSDFNGSFKGTGQWVPPPRETVHVYEIPDALEPDGSLSWLAKKIAFTVIRNDYLPVGGDEEWFWGYVEVVVETDEARVAFEALLMREIAMGSVRGVGYYEEMLRRIAVRVGTMTA